MDSSVQVPEVVLNSGHKMPLVGLGTAASPLPPPDQLMSIFLDAMEIGYRHFDTAKLYSSEEGLGRAVAKALERGLINNGNDVFITSKLWCTDAHPDLVLPALKETLRKLGLNYVDLYLIHWPVRIKHGAENFSHDAPLPFDIKGTWKAMETCCKLGLAKSVGVSNFSSGKLSQILEHATIPPVVNQVEMHVAWRQQKLLQFCKEKGILLSAWSPLAANGASWGSLAVMESPVLKAIAASKQKTVAQVALRWVFQQGASVIVKSFNKERMKQNLQIFDWELTDDELRQIEQITQKRGVTGDWCVHPNGPYKSLEDLWDEAGENS